MNTKMSKRQRDLKAKLMAAIAMLLVSSIMMVSTTYAWFTLSTAPEVTGITTAVGANGNLEMALLPKEAVFQGDFGVTSAVGDGNIQDATLKNITWGNLVNLSEGYGLQDITLYPSALNVSGQTADSMGSIATANPLKYPLYGADGRVTELTAGTNTSVYDSTKGFMPNDFYGVRAVGSASGMTPRQQTYRIAKSNAAAAASTAANRASALLKSNGSSLGNIAMQYGANSTAAKFTYADVVALQTMANGMNEVFAKIDEAYLQYMLAYAASSATTDDTGADGQLVAGSGDAKYAAMKALIDGSNNNLNTFMQSLVNAEMDPKVVMAPIMTGITELGYSYTDANGVIQSVPGTKGKINEALNGYGEHAGINALLALDGGAQDKADYTWAQISPILSKLANPDYMKVNGIDAATLKQNVDQLIPTISGGINIEIRTGGGVFADVADQTNDYVATGILIEDVAMGSVPLGDLTVNMQASGKTPSWLTAVGSAIPAAPQGGSGQVAISDMYGYIIDLAFKTNAAGSKLVLQQTPVDRIYTGNTANGGAEDENGLSTMGHGANMTFTSTNSSFDSDDVKALMDNIVIVFFNAEDGAIVHYAKLDTAGATESSTGAITAKIKLVEAPSATDVTNYAHTTNEPETAANGDRYEWTVYWKERATAGETNGTMLYRVRTVAALEDDPTTSDVVDPVPETKVWEKAVYQTTTTTPSEGETAVTTTTFKEWVATTAADTITTAANETALQSALQAAGAQGVTTPKGTYAWSSNQEIMDLPQNAAVQLSALVYLDGETITNADVSATGSKSLTGEMNLQFSSTATLTPMNYTPLVNTTGANTNGGSTTVTVTETADSDETASLTAINYDATNKKITFKLANTDTAANDYAVTYNGTPLTASADGVYTIENVEASVQVKITATAKNGNG